MRFALCLFLLVPAIASAELTTQEKNEVRKIHEAGVHFGNGYTFLIDGSTFNPGGPGVPGFYLSFSVRRYLLQANLYLLQAPPGYNMLPLDSFPDRGSVVSTALRMVGNFADTIETDYLNRARDIAPIANDEYRRRIEWALPEFERAVTLLRSVDSSLPYANPRLSIYPLQFGPHGDYDSAQEQLGHFATNFGYAHNFLGSIDDLDMSRWDCAWGNCSNPFTGYIRAAMFAADGVSRIINLSANVTVNYWDDQLNGSCSETVRKALREIELGFNPAWSSGAGQQMGAAVGALTAVMAHEAERGNVAAIPRLRIAIQQMVGSWTNIDGWVNQFLQISNVEIPGCQQ